MNSMIEVESIKTNFATLIARVEVVQKTWIKIKNDIPTRAIDSLRKLHSDQQDKTYLSAVALFDIIRFILYGVKENSGCAEYYWTPQEKFGRIPTSDVHASFQRSHCSTDYVEYQKQEIAKRLKSISNKDPNFSKHTLVHYSGLKLSAFNAQLDSAIENLNVIHTALLKLVRDRYESTIVNELVEHSIRCQDNSQYRQKFHRSCYNVYKEYENTEIVAVSRQRKPSVGKPVLVSEAMDASNKKSNKRKSNIFSDDEGEATYPEIGDVGSATKKGRSEKRKSTTILSDDEGEATYPEICDMGTATKKGRSEEIYKETNAGDKGESDNPEIILSENETYRLTSRDLLLHDSDTDLLVPEKSVAENNKLPHTTVIDLRLDDGPEVDIPEDTIVDSRVEKLESGLDSKWTVELENAKSELVLSFKDMLSISISGSIQTVAQLVPISSIDFAITAKEFQPNQAITSTEDAFLSVLKHTGTTASKYGELQTLIVKALLNDPTCIKFDEHEYEYLSEALISYGSQCKAFAKITMKTFEKQYPDGPDLKKLKADLNQTNQSIAKNLNGFVAYIMREFVKGSMEKGEEFIEKHLNAVASCEFVYLEVKESRNNMDKIVHDKDKIKDVKDNILRKIKSSSAIGHQSNKLKIKDVSLPPPPLLLQRTTATTIESPNVVDDYVG